MAQVQTRPLILVRGFGGLDVSAERANAYQGFNEGTVYPGRRGDNYIYEGFVLRALKSDSYRYTDATNVVGYYASDVEAAPDDDGWDPSDTSGTVAVDPAVARRVLREAAKGTLWVYRFYDLSPRSLERYGTGLVRLVDLIEQAVERHEPGSFDGVDLVCHSMGGLVMREALLAMDAREAGSARRRVHRVVTLGTPHRGIAFSRMPDWLLSSLPGVAERGSDELRSFSPHSTRFLQLEGVFPLARILTVVGTDHRGYSVGAASALNRLSTLLDEGTLATNRSDGLVKHSAAQLPGAPRTFVHKSHGGHDSVVNSRETYEITMRFLHGTHRVRLWLEQAQIRRGRDWFGKSEFYLGVSIKPRYVDFELFHQSPEAENCYGPFRTADLSDDLPDLQAELRKPLADSGDETTGWAGADRLLWEGWVDAGQKPSEHAPGMVFRLDLYVGERDTYGIGFSDNVVFRKQYYVQAFPGASAELFLHTGEEFLGRTSPVGQEQLRELADEQDHLGAQAPVQRLVGAGDRPGWYLDVDGTGFTGRLRVAVEADPHGA